MDFNDTTIQPRPSSGNRCYTVQDLQDILGVGRKSVYSLLKRKEFRWIRVGAVYRIPKKSFDEWLESGNSVFLTD
jgi:excisionase family DNA binding protein